MRVGVSESRTQTHETTAPSIATKVAFLSRADSYREAPSRVEVLETHMSWVFLTGRHAYKLKKPVRLAYLDYGSVEARRRNAIEELRLNRRLSAGVYFAAVPLAVDAAGSLALDGPGAPVDWLVKMRRLPGGRMLDVLIRQQKLGDGELASVVGHLCRFYRGAPAESMSAAAYRRRFDSSIATWHEVLRRPGHGLPEALVDGIADGQRHFLAQHAGLLDERVRRGRIVEAHGDLRPEHVCVEREPQVIDCLEFSRDLRLQDSADELSFLALECERLGAPQLRDAIFAGYREALSDAPPEALIEFYQSHRALVRAGLAIRHIDDGGVRDRDRWYTHARDYLRFARDHVERCA
jgi:aminoglycoside phosphotransferase family enzyme